MVARMASATAVVTAAGPTAEEDDEGRLARAYLGGGWAMDDCEPTEEELEYRQERARPAQQAKALWLQRLTAVSRLPAPNATCCAASSPRPCGSTCRPRCCACPRTASVRCSSARSRSWSSSWPRWTPRWTGHRHPPTTV